MKIYETFFNQLAVKDLTFCSIDQELIESISTITGEAFAQFCSLIEQKTIPFTVKIDFNFANKLILDVKFKNFMDFVDGLVRANRIYVQYFCTQDPNIKFDDLKTIAEQYPYLSSNLDRAISTLTYKPEKNDLLNFLYKRLEWQQNAVYIYKGFSNHDIYFARYNLDYDDIVSWLNENSQSKSISSEMRLDLAKFKLDWLCSKPSFFTDFCLDEMACKRLIKFAMQQDEIRSNISKEIVDKLTYEERFEIFINSTEKDLDVIYAIPEFYLSDVATGREKVILNIIEKKIRSLICLSDSYNYSEMGQILCKALKDLFGEIITGTGLNIFKSITDKLQTFTFPSAEGIKKLSNIFCGACYFCLMVENQNLGIGKSEFKQRLKQYNANDSIFMQKILDYVSPQGRIHLTRAYIQLVQNECAYEFFQQLKFDKPRFLFPGLLLANIIARSDQETTKSILKSINSGYKFSPNFNTMISALIEIYIIDN